jgi:CRISPR/Cas system-associated exonuclease Cas4 (RecB family)
MRCIITNSLQNPEGAETQQAMELLGSDPMYLLLCKRQKSFRARLTPKPWRCGMGNPNITFPFGNDKAEKRFTDLQKKYNKKIESYATCRFMAQLGNSQIDPAVGQAVKLHDQLTRATAQLPLA